MRYYPAVGPAIPHTRVGRSRVTHPFAGHPELPPSALDLHVLSTPPAFVLSQDQTLQKVSSISSPNADIRHDIQCRVRNQYSRELFSPHRARARRIIESHRTISHSIVK
jgi:hypothetical protein